MSKFFTSAQFGLLCFLYGRRRFTSYLERADEVPTRSYSHMLGLLTLFSSPKSESTSITAYMKPCFVYCVSKFVTSAQFLGLSLLYGGHRFAYKVEHSGEVPTEKEHLFISVYNCGLPLGGRKKDHAVVCMIGISCKASQILKTRDWSRDCWRAAIRTTALGVDTCAFVAGVHIVREKQTSIAKLLHTYYIYINARISSVLSVQTSLSVRMASLLVVVAQKFASRLKTVQLKFVFFFTKNI